MNQLNNILSCFTSAPFSALFHDLGLTKHFSSPDKRFEVDGANAARDFLKSRSVPHESSRLVWHAIALHTTIGVAQYKATLKPMYAPQ